MCRDDNCVLVTVSASSSPGHNYHPAAGHWDELVRVFAVEASLVCAAVPTQTHCRASPLWPILAAQFHTPSQGPVKETETKRNYLIYYLFIHINVLNICATTTYQTILLLSFKLIPRSVTIITEIE